MIRYIFYFIATILLAILGYYLGRQIGWMGVGLSLFIGMGLGHVAGKINNYFTYRG